MGSGWSGGGSGLLAVEVKAALGVRESVRVIGTDQSHLP